jgi:HK97 family phage portal protein
MKQENKSLIKRMGLRLKGLFSGQGSDGPMFYGHNWQFLDGLAALFSRSRIDYEQEVGDVTRNSMVMAAARWVGSTLPEAPLVVMSNAKGKDEIVPAHPLVKLFKLPNQFHSGSTLLKCFALSWITDGNVFFLKRRNARGVPVELYYLPHWMVYPRWPKDGSQFINHYEYIIDGVATRYEPSEIVHISDGMNPITRRGTSPLRSLFREIFSDNEAANFSAALLINSGIPPYIVTSKDNADIDEESLKDAIKRQTTGDNRGEPIVASGGIEIKQLSFNPESLNLKAARMINEERVSAVLGIPAIVLGFGAGLERSTFANFKEAREAYTESYLLPLWRHVAEELSLQLLPDFTTDESLRVAHDLTQVRVLQDDQNKLYERLTIGVKGGWIKRAEARAAVGLEVTPEDDVYIPSSGNDSATANGSLAAKGIEYKTDIVLGELDIDEGLQWWLDNAPAAARELIRAEAVNA